MGNWLTQGVEADMCGNRSNLSIHPVPDGKSDVAGNRTCTTLSVVHLLTYSDGKVPEKPVLGKVLETPWRTFERQGDWENNYRDRLIQAIKSTTVYGELDHIKILLLGPVGAGKSSFISSIASIDKDRIAMTAMPGGQTARSYSTRLFQYIPKHKLGGPYRIMDVMGIEEVEGKGFHAENIIYLMQGNIKPTYEFQSENPIDSERDPNFIAKPTLMDKPQCTVIILPAKIIYSGEISDLTKAKIKQLQTNIKRKEVPVILMLTKMDILCEEEGIKITGIYTNRKTKEVVDKASEIFGIPVMNIFPVQNYTKESDLDVNMDILLLLALRRMLHYANDQLEYMDDQNK